MECPIHVISLMTIIAMGLSEVVKGPEPVLQRTVAALFSGESDAEDPGDCRGRWLNSSRRQAAMCRREPGLPAVLVSARTRARDHCRDAFRYDRWNCALDLNGKPRRNIFKNVYRETALVHALVAASLAHGVARACAAGALSRCSCAKGGVGDARKQWKKNGCGDDIKHGKRTTRNFLELSRADTDNIAEVLQQDVGVGLAAVTQQMREVCKCHGFSGSCTMKTCWKRVGAFNSTVALLKRYYHRAVRKKVANYVSRRAARAGGARARAGERQLVYLVRSPNLCARTRGRRCRDPDNCATLCCGRGFTTESRTRETRCHCRWVDCCYVSCQKCLVDEFIYTCK